MFLQAEADAKIQHEQAKLPSQEEQELAECTFHPQINKYKNEVLLHPTNSTLRRVPVTERVYEVTISLSFCIYFFTFSVLVFYRCCVVCSSNCPVVHPRFTTILTSVLIVLFIVVQVRDKLSFLDEQKRKREEEEIKNTCTFAPQV